MALTPVPGAKVIDANLLTGSMMVEILAGPQSSITTLDNLAQFLESDSLSNIVSTSITTVGAGTLTAAAMKGGLIVRSGSVAAYTDTTTTAALLLAALGSDAVVGTSWLLYIKNLTAFSVTIAAGTGVTLTGNKDVIPPNGLGVYLITYATNAPTFTMQGIFVSALTSGLPEAIGSLTTVGAGTVLAATIAGGILKRTGSTSAFTDTTDTADLIIAAIPNARIGQSFEWTYFNNTVAAATLTGGTGVTVSAVTVVPPTMWARFLVTYTAASTITIAGIAMGPCVALPAGKVTTGTAATFAAGDITGAYYTDYINNASNATLTVRTAAQMFADIPNCLIGFSYRLSIRNLNATSATLTADGGATVTLSGTMTIAQNATRNFNVVFPTASTCTITSMGGATAAA